jgi:pimeloyl-ACP methyl ester carboxylesterase
VPATPVDPQPRTASAWDPATASGWRHGQVQARDLQLHFVEAGDPDGELVLLLHGFPECWYSWRLQMGPLATPGRRVVALDLPGFGRSSAPSSLEAFSLEALASVIVDVVSQLNRGRPAVAIVGHDWGGAIAWVIGALYPRSARRLAIINCPPGYALRRAWRIPKQVIKSWYIFFFQIPRLPEALLRLGRFRFVDQALAPAQRRNPAAVPAESVAFERAEMARPGVLTSTLNYYRAVVRLGPTALHRLERPVTVPTLLIWGDRDPYLDVQLTRDFPRWAQDGRLVHLPQAGHFSHQEEPEPVNQLLTDWLAAA